MTSTADAHLKPRSRGIWLVNAFMPRLPSALASSMVLRTTISRPTGPIIAPPMPCSNRAATNCGTRCWPVRTAGTPLDLDRAKEYAARRDLNLAIQVLNSRRRLARAWISLAATFH